MWRERQRQAKLAKEMASRDAAVKAELDLAEKERIAAAARRIELQEKLREKHKSTVEMSKRLLSGASSVTGNTGTIGTESNQDGRSGGKEGKKKDKKNRFSEAAASRRRCLSRRMMLLSPDERAEGRPIDARPRRPSLRRAST